MKSAQPTPPPYARLIEKTKELGFQKAGLLTLPDLTKEGENLKTWLAQGFHADMQWMVENLDKRLSPETLMPKSKSILCVGMNYYPGDLEQEAEAKVARYAQGDDYHNVLKARLKALLVWLKTHDERIEGRPLVDSAPILEKALAVKAGLGWYGKHSNLITRDMGSWIFLGELLLNITFPDAPSPDPMANFCGTCRRCIEACPTDAIVESYVVDANRCVSYWTIEYKGEEIPAQIQENLNGWLFGCDICQEVCPWNIKFQQLTPEAAFQPRPWNRFPRLNEIKTLTPKQFKTRYRKSPLKRPKLSGLQRNATLLHKISAVIPP